MDSESSDYDVEHYIKPIVRKTTNENDNYLSESSESSKNSNSEKSSDEEILEDQKTAQCTFKNKVFENDQKTKEPVRTCARLILHVSNLPDSIEKDLLINTFSPAGNIKSVRMPRNRKFAFVEMQDMQSYKVIMSF
jgi:RNA recognition motif-containing protein